MLGEAGFDEAVVGLYLAALVIFGLLFLPYLAAGRRLFFLDSAKGRLPRIGTLFRAGRFYPSTLAYAWWVGCQLVLVYVLFTAVLFTPLCQHE